MRSSAFWRPDLGQLNGQLGRNAAPGGQTSRHVTGLSSAWPFHGLFFSWCLLCWFPVPRLRQPHFNEASFVPSLPDVIPPPLSPLVTMEMAASQTRHDQPGELLPGANPSFAEAAFYRGESLRPTTSFCWQLGLGSNGKSCSPQAPGEVSDVLLRAVAS